MKKLKMMLIMAIMCTIVVGMGDATTASAAEVYSDSQQNECTGQTLNELEGTNARSAIKKYRVVVDRATIRSEAGSSSKVIGYYYKNTTFSGEEKNGWIKIRYSGKDGYVNKSEVKKI